VSLGQGGKKIPRTWTFTKRPCHKHFTTTKIAKNGMHFFSLDFFITLFGHFSVTGVQKHHKQNVKK
jgi:hypothetical protein